MSLLTGTKSAATFVFNNPTVSSIVSTLNNVTTVGRLVDYSIDSGNIDKDLAIIGMSCRFPGGVEFPAMFWDLIKSGECTSEKVSFSRWDAEAERARLKHMSESAAEVTVWSSFVKDLELFDAGFFGTSPAEVSVMDPQQRLLLECAYLAFVDEGYTRESLMGQNVGVYVGVAPLTNVEGLLFNSPGNVYALSGADQSTAAGRISFVFGLRSLSTTYNTACPSSLVALHAAARDLKYGDCSLAIVFGGNALLTQQSHCILSEIQMTFPSGRCHTFDDSADGYPSMFKSLPSMDWCGYILFLFCSLSLIW